MNSNLSVRQKTGIIYHLVPVLLFIINPFSMPGVSQRIIFSALLLTVIWWGTGFVSRHKACIFLLAVFLLSGKSTPQGVFNFAFSPSFYLIVFSFLLAQGISNSGVADKLASLVLRRYGNTAIRVVFLSFLFGAVLIFIVPQPTSRVILLSAVYGAFLDNVTEEAETREILLYSIFIASTTTSMLFINGDIVLNHLALQLGQVEMSSGEWLKLMFIPTLFTNVMVFVAFVLTFRKRIFALAFTGQAGGKEGGEGSSQGPDKGPWAALIMLAVVLLWLTEDVHGIGGAFIALAGVVAMLGVGVLGLRDLKHVNFGLLLFLVTVSAVGTVLEESGISSLVFAKLSILLPQSNLYGYLVCMALIIMVLHMFIGSCIATLSLVLPSFISMSVGLVNPIVVTLLNYVVVNIHYIFPFHHVTIMVGCANRIFSDKLVLRFGLVLTLVTIIALVGFYLPWWKVLGLI